ncbi:uncharacterized protein MELLADRAFT_86116 [Melampsora larici-populina 98AG31]|uniref:Uncharacterized protein n=1 Tax=Melampsora larici-populina (strain 98AG31 / pathotype 3-4-7) TaxID=747676 RepID=F4SDK7_MELLP|nr:uncharacterized protein MELLADRAFT_86116 [Melampsora larici-populina 98AG31]EGF97266.1 hypothetical protein MELLADRAFT_86116 [Melampsora larici-populina 98AG31]
MLDPGAAGVTKQMMLDWLRINHPKSPISSSISKSEAAVKVREKQPKFFPDPKSDRPAMFIHQDLIFRNGTDRANNQLRPPSPHETKPVLPQPDAEIPLGNQFKRSASPSSSTRPSKRSNISTKELSRQMGSIKKNVKDKKRKQVAFSPKAMQAPTQAVSSKPVVNVMEEETQRDINALQHYEAPAMSPSASHMVKSPLVEQQPIPPTIQPMDDLIDLSDGDILSVGNLEIDIPPLKLPTSKVKSGVDVFHEERARADKTVGVLEASVSELSNRIECVEKQSSTNMAQHEGEKIETGMFDFLFDALIYF